LDKKVDALLVSSLDDIDWILNLRGNDIAYNPVFISYFIFFPVIEEGQQHHAKLFIDAPKVSDESVQNHLKANRVEVCPYDGIWECLTDLTQNKKRIGYDENVCNQRLFEVIESAKPIHFDAAIENVKAVKNPVEMQGMRNANIKNCASLIEYFAWMEDFLRKNPS
jgi:Xaa-Pro aminopeptidase